MKGGEKMETKYAAAILFELVVFIFIVWGFLNEDKLIAFEDRVWMHIRYKLRKNQDVIYMRHEIKNHKK